jgi:hypothetical protein
MLLCLHRKYKENMKKIIHNLRQKPAHVRRMIAFVTSITFTALVGIIWISNLIALGVNASADTAVVEEKTPSPIALLYGQAKELLKSTGNQLAEVSSAFNFMQSTTTSRKLQPAKNTIATSTDGSIGISTTNNDPDTSNVNSLTEEQ